MNVVSERKKRILRWPYVTRASIVHYLLTFAAILIVSLIGAILVPFFDLVNIALLYLLPVIISAVRWGRGPSFFAAFFGVLSFDYFFVPPAFGFRPDNPHDYFNLFIFLLVALVTGTMATKLRNELEKTSSREKRTLALYAVSEKIAAESDLRLILINFADNIGNAIKREIIVLMHDPDTDTLHEEAVFPPNSSLIGDKEWLTAYWVLEHGQRTEREIEDRNGARAMFFPVKAEDRTVAVLAVKPGTDGMTLTLAQVQLMEAFANLMSAAITRVKLAKEAESAQWQAESKKLHLAAIVESSADAIISVNPYGTIVSWNLGAEAIYGYSAEEVVGRSISTLVSIENRDDVPLVLERIKSGERIKFYETVQIRKDGERIYVSLTMSPIRDASGQVVGVSTVARDITERKRKEDQLKSSTEQLRALSARLQSIREEERTILARDIHDELGQRLTGLMMDLVSLSQKPPKNRELLTHRIQSMETIINDTIQLVRKISTELRPGVLDDLGLVAALEWQINDFRNRTLIECEFSSALDDIDLNRDVITALFRIFQETLTNIIRHADATHVRIDIKKDGDCILLAIEDNGKGISESEISDPKSLGLLGIHERALIFGGDVHITGSEGKGTRVVVRMPHKQDV